MRKTLLFVLSFLSFQVFSQTTSFVKAIGGSSDDYAQKVVQLSSGDYFILSTTESYGVGGSDIMVTRTNGLGDIIWSYAYGSGGNETATSMKLASDGGILITGYSDNIATNADAAFIMKLTSSGSVTWNTTLVSDSTVRAYDIVESRTGGYFVTGYAYVDSLDDNIFVTSMSTSGNFFWTKTYGGINKDHGYSIAEDSKGRLLIAGSTMNDSVTVGGSGDTDIQLIRMRTNGNVIWTRNYGSNSKDVATHVKFANNQIYMTGYTEDGFLSGENMMICRVDTNGTVQSSGIYGTNGDDRGYSLQFPSSSLITLAGSVKGISSPGDIAVLTLNTSGSIVNTSVVGGDSIDGVQGVDAYLAPDGSVSVVSNGKSLRNSSSLDLYLYRASTSGVVNCGSKLEIIDGIGYNLSSNSHDYSTTLSAGANLSFSSTSVTSSDTVICCQLEARVASDTIRMCTGDQVRLGRNGISGYIYSWTAVGSSYTSSAANPLVSPSSTTTYKLVVSEANGDCIGDSALVHVIVNSRLNVDFARDTFFCEGLSVVVPAYPGLNSYLWFGDGYTKAGNNQSFNIEDTVVLTVIDNNSCVYNDTIAITEIPTPTFSLGADTTICSNVPITIEGPDDMASYTWNGTTSSNSTFTTSTQQVLTLVVVDSFGCTASDNIVIQTKPFSTFSLGPDTSFCEGGVFIIQGPGALSDYIWNDTASNLKDIGVYEAGQYTLTAYNSFGCPYSDTINISELPLPVFSLGPDDGFCEGVGKVLTGPASMIQYDWSTGSTQDTTTALVEGDYSLRVTDNNGCRYSDTIYMTEYANPVITLGNDTTICIGTTLDLSPGAGYADYDWSTSQSSITITVQQKGTYSVTVTDNNGCKGTASINVDTVTCTNSIHYLGSHKVNVFPIPASSKLNISSDISLMSAELQLYNAVGDLVIRKTSTSHEPILDVNALADGVYTLKITKDNKQALYRVVVSH